MIKSEQHLKKEFFKTMGVISVICLMISFLLKDPSILGGYLLGALLSYAVLALDIVYVDIILQSKVKKANPIPMFVLLMKMGIYALGFLVAVYVPVAFCLYSVAIGYFTNKLTIYRLSAKKEVNR